MSAPKGAGGFVWGAVLVGAVAWALAKDPKPPRVAAAPPVAAAAVATPPPVASPATPRDALLTPAERLNNARVFMKHGLRNSSDRTAAYTVAWYQLKAIPRAAPEASDAGKLLTEVEARMRQPSFAKAPPASREDVFELLSRLEGDSPATLAVRPRGPREAATGQAPPLHPTTPPPLVEEGAIPKAPRRESVAVFPPPPAARSPLAYDYPRAPPPLDGYGTISPETGRPKTHYVQPYTRADGTQVRGYYRSR